MARTLRLLLVEDSEDDALLMVEELRKGGFDPDFKRVDTPQALESALEDGGWDAVIADYNLPSFTGIEALRIVQAKGIDLPLLLVSGAIGEELAAEAMKAGFHDFIMKGHYLRLTQALERELREIVVRRERREALEGLRRAHAELEQRVAERTAELVIAHKEAEKTNERLRCEIEERKRAEEILGEKEHYLRTILQTTADGFCVINAEGKITQVNEAYCRMSAYTCDELLKLDLFAIDAVEEPAQVLARIQRIIANESEIFETRHRRKDGSVFEVELSVSYMDTGSGTFVCFCRDITERKQAEKNLQNLNNELERRVEQRTRELQETQLHFLHAEKLSAVGKLSAAIAHEFNNPLQGIMSILKGLKKRAILEEEDRELLDAAIGESERMKNLIRSLQEFNRPSSGKKVVMDVHKSIDSLLLLCKNDFKTKRISTVLNYAEQLPAIIAVPDQIKQVFLNLLTNAADACFQRGGVITISTWQEEKKVAVAIKDTGTGIAPENTGLLFQPFYTTKSEVKGTGLGLSICHGIIQSHQGEIRVESRTGEGSTFTVLLPI